MVWSEVMNWSDILVRDEFEFISSSTTDNEYRGDSDLITTEEKRGAFDAVTSLTQETFV